MPAFATVGLLGALAVAGVVRTSIRIGGLTGGGTVGLDPWRRVLADPAFAEAFVFTLWVATASTVLAVGAALPLSLALRSTGRSGVGRSGAGRSGVMAPGSVNLPVAAPHLVVATLAILWLGPGGLADRLLEPVVGVVPWDLTGDRWGIGVILVYAWKEVPFLVLLALAALDDATAELEDTAAMLGAGRLARWRDVILPRLAVPLGGGALVVTAFVIGAVEVPLVVGPTSPRTLGTHGLHVVRLDGPIARPDAAVAHLAALALTLSAALGLVVVARHQRRRQSRSHRPVHRPGHRPGHWLSHRFGDRGAQLSGGGGRLRHHRPRGLALPRLRLQGRRHRGRLHQHRLHQHRLDQHRLRQGRRHRWTGWSALAGRLPGGVVGAAGLVMAGPFLALIVQALADQWVGRSLLPQRLGWRGVRAVAADPAMLDAIVNSALVALGAAIVSVVVAWPAARFLARSPSVTAWAALGFTVLLPPLVMGDGLAVWFVAVGFSDTPAAVAVAHLGLTIPYAALGLVPVFTEAAVEIDHSAAVLGAGPLRRTRDLLVPAARANLMLAFALAFTVSWSQYGTSLAVGGGTPMLPLVLVPFVRADPQIAAVLALVFMAPPGLLLGAAARSRTAAG